MKYGSRWWVLPPRTVAAYENQPVGIRPNKRLWIDQEPRKWLDERSIQWVLGALPILVERGGGHIPLYPLQVDDGSIGNEYAFMVCIGFDSDDEAALFKMFWS